MTRSLEGRLAAAVKENDSLNQKLKDQSKKIEQQEKEIIDLKKNCIKHERQKKQSDKAIRLLKGLTDENQ